MTSSDSRFGSYENLALAIVPVVGASVLGQIATYLNISPWYAALLKPSFNPPDWVFGPVWTILFILMAFSAWRILILPSTTPGRSFGLILYYAQLILNAAWSWMFFAANNPLLGLINIVPQWLVILYCIIVFRRLDHVAAITLVPLAMWVGFAGILNAEIFRLNA